MLGVVSHRDFTPLVEQLSQRQGGFSLPSVRVAMNGLNAFLQHSTVPLGILGWSNFCKLGWVGWASTEGGKEKHQGLGV